MEFIALLRSTFRPFPLKHVCFGTVGLDVETRANQDEPTFMPLASVGLQTMLESPGVAADRGCLLVLAEVMRTLVPSPTCGSFVWPDAQ